MEKATLQWMVLVNGKSLGFADSMEQVAEVLELEAQSQLSEGSWFEENKHLVEVYPAYDQPITTNIYKESPEAEISAKRGEPDMDEASEQGNEEEEFEIVASGQYDGETFGTMDDVESYLRSEIISGNLSVKEAQDIEFKRTSSETYKFENIEEGELEIEFELTGGGREIYDLYTAVEVEPVTKVEYELFDNGRSLVKALKEAPEEELVMINRAMFGCQNLIMKRLKKLRNQSEPETSLTEMKSFT